MNVSVERVVNDATLKITLPAEEVNKGFKKAISKIANTQRWRFWCSVRQRFRDLPAGPSMSRRSLAAVLLLPVIS